PSLGSPWLISGLAALYGRSRIADWLRITNVTISNVPGSRVPVYLCGARMTDYYPLSIVVHGVALNITVQSHVDQLCFGLIACRRAVPDVHELGGHVTRAMATLRALVAALPAPAEAPKESGVPAAASATAPRPPRLRVVASSVGAGPANAKSKSTRAKATRAKAATATGAAAAPKKRPRAVAAARRRARA
ncbi:MAG: WS/DGAT domain-containing protein, partial [Caldimonas sp.]